MRLALILAGALLSACAVTGPRAASDASADLRAPGLSASDAIVTGAVNVPSGRELGVMSPGGAAKPAKVAMLLPLSGPGAMGLMAKGLREAAELAVFDHPGAGPGASIELSTKDDQGTPEGAQSAFAQAQAEGADIVLGPVFAASVAAISHQAREAKVPVIAFSSDRKVATPGVYLMSILAEDEVQRIVSFAARAGHRRFASLLPSAGASGTGSYERLLEVAVNVAMQREGATLAAAERYPKDANGMIEPVQQLALKLRDAEQAGAPITALFVAGDKAALTSLNAVLKTTSIDPAKIKVIGIGDFSDVGPERESVFDGAWYPGADPKGWRDFAARYQRAYGVSPPRIASLAYDAVSLTIEVANQSARQGHARLDPTLLVLGPGIPGIDGPVRLRADGLPSRGLAILEAHARGPVVVDGPAAPAEILPLIPAEPNTSAKAAVFHSTN